MSNVSDDANIYKMDSFEDQKIFEMAYSGDFEALTNALRQGIVDFNLTVYVCIPSSLLSS